MSDNTDPRLLDIYNDLLDAVKAKLKSENVTAADINAALAVMKANGITSLRTPGNKLDEAASALENLDIDKFPFAVSSPILPSDDPAVTYIPPVKAAGSQ